MQKIMGDTMNAHKQATEWMREHFNFITPGTPLYHQIHDGLRALGTNAGILAKDAPQNTPASVKVSAERAPETVKKAVSENTDPNPDNHQ